MTSSPRPITQDFQKGTFERLQEWRRNMKFVDTLIVCQSKTIGAHQIILASTIPYFEQTLLAESDTRPRRQVNLDHLDPSSLMELIDFVYTGNLEITIENIESIMITAAFLGMQNVKNSCVQFVLASILNVNNCIGWKQLAVKMGEKSFADKCDQFMRDNVEAVIRSPQVAVVPQLNINLQLDTIFGSKEMEESKFIVQKLVPSIIQLLRELSENSDQSIAMLSESTLCLQSTDGVSVLLQSQRDWNQNSPCTSPNKLSKTATARHLDMDEELPIMAWQEVGLVQTSSTTFTILASLASSTALLNITTAIDYPISPTTGLTNNIVATASSGFVASTNESRCSAGIVTMEDDVYVIGGYNRNSCLDSVELYNKATNRWQYIDSMRTKRSQCNAVVMNDSIYAFGGSDGHRDLNSMEVYTPVTGEWKTTKATMLEGRSSFGAAVVNGNIYAIGGTQYSYPLASAECYDSVKQKWTSIPEMRISRNDLAVAALDGKIYAIGGEQSTSGCTSTVECYNVKSCTWEPVASLKTPRRGACAVAFDGKIYVFGGCTGAKVLNTVEIYDPKDNSWSPGTSMTLPRCSLICSVLGNQIMIAGGFNGSTFLNTVEFYIPSEDKWTSFV